MRRLLLIYSTTDGQTLKICERIATIFKQRGWQVALASVEAAWFYDLDLFQQVVIGASIRYGHHHQQVFDFVAHNAAALNHMPSAFFTVNVVARKPNKNQPGTNPYMLKFLRRVAWRPSQLAVFAGRIEYRKYGLFDRCMIRFIMWLTNGPTDPATAVEFTDWQKVESFAEVLAVA